MNRYQAFIGAAVTLAAAAPAKAAPDATADGTQYLQSEPPAGQLGVGQRVLVDDKTCPAGQIKEVIGGGKMAGWGGHGSGHADRQRKCIPRPG